MATKGHGLDIQYTAQSEATTAQPISIHLPTRLHTAPPIQRIPSELLGEIFLRCLPRRRHPALSLAPLLLCRICSRWRSVALALNKLWDEFCLLYDYTDGRSVKLVRAAQNWFTRAGEYLPLSLIICYDHSMLYKGLLQKVLVPLAHRFRHVDFGWNGNTDLMPFFVLCPRLLVSAELTFPGGLDASSIARIDIPSLRKVSLSSVISSTLNPHLRDDILVWDRLTHLIITEATEVHILVDLLARCRSLQKLACVAVGVDSRILFDTLFVTLEQHVILPHLYDFDITLFPERSHSFLPLFRLRFPQIRRFRLRGGVSGGDAEGMLWGEGTHFISQFGNLTDFGVSGYNLTPEQLLDTLRFIPNLVTLDLDVRANFGQICQAMTRTSQGSELVPLLEDITFRLESSDMPNFSITTFVNMVHSRLKHIGIKTEPRSCIRNISLLAPSANQSVLDEVKSLLKNIPGEGTLEREYFNKKYDSHPGSVMDIDLASW